MIFSLRSIHPTWTFADGTQVITDPDQSSTFLGARYIYKFQ